MARDRVVGEHIGTYRIRCSGCGTPTGAWSIYCPGCGGCFDGEGDG